MTVPVEPMEDTPEMVTRREAILRVTAILGGVALVGGTSLLTGCRRRDNTDAPFTAEDIAFLDEVAETILPQTKTPGAKAAKTGAFMALIVTDSYEPKDRKIFREGMRKVDAACRKAHDVSFMSAAPQQRLAVLEPLDREQSAWAQSRRDEDQRKKREALLTDERKEVAPGSDAGAATAITAEPSAGYFRMMKELALLGYFTSEIGYTQAQRYMESPGRFDPCVPYTPGERSWADHA
jgi:hypothetical protein